MPRASRTPVKPRTWKAWAAITKYGALIAIERSPKNAKFIATSFYVPGRVVAGIFTEVLPPRQKGRKEAR